MVSKIKILTMSNLILLLVILSGNCDVKAQFKVKKDSLEKSTWYEAPRQIQIIDDSPIIHDYRPAPQTNQDNQYVNIPANPGGNSSSIPAGGLHFGTPAARVSAGSNLPSAGFGTNIPVGGIAHPRSLPGISHGGLLHPPSSAPVANAPPATSYKPSAPAVSSYGGYNSGGGNSYVGSSNKSTQTNVRGTLLRK